MKIIADESKEIMQDLEPAKIFHFGAPFSAYIHGNVWSEEDNEVYNYVNGVLDTNNGTTGWQNVFPVAPIVDVLPNGGWGIVHIDDPKFDFAPYTLQQYYDMLPVLPEVMPEGLTEADYLNSNELAIKQRIEAIDESLWTLTPQAYVSQYIIADNYLVIDNWMPQ